MGDTSQRDNRDEEKSHEGDVANITRSGKHYKPSFLEKEHLGRNIGEDSKPMEHKGKVEKEEEDIVLT